MNMTTTTPNMMTPQLISQSIVFENLSLNASLGITKHERAHRQPVQVSVYLTVDSGPCQNDQISEVLNYDRVYDSLSALVERKSYHLQESLCTSMAWACLSLPFVSEVDIHLAKKEAYPNCSHTGVRQVWKKH